MNDNSHHRGYVSVSGAYDGRNQTAPLARNANIRQASSDFRDPQHYWLRRGEYHLQPQQTRGLEIRPGRQIHLGSSVNRSPQPAGSGADGMSLWNQPFDLTGGGLQPTPYTQRGLGRRDNSNVDQNKEVGAATLSDSENTRHYPGFTSGSQHSAPQMMAFSPSSHVPWEPMIPSQFGRHDLAQSGSENLMTVDNQQRKRFPLAAHSKEMFDSSVDPRYPTPAPAPTQTVLGGRPTAEDFTLGINNPLGHGVFSGGWDAGMFGQPGAQSIPASQNSGEPFGSEQAAVLELKPESSKFNFGGQSTAREPDESHLAPPFQQQPSPGQSSPSPSADVQPQPTVLRCPKENCDSIFKGDYRRGNLARHIRVQHGGRQGTPRSFPCEEVGCSSTFRRKDARLKHYRKTHPERLETPPLRRK